MGNIYDRDFDISRTWTVDVGGGPTEEELSQQETLEEGRKKKKKLSRAEQIREDIIELNYRALNHDESFVDLIIKYIILREKKK